MQEDDITKMLAATTHIGSDNSETTMEQYIFKKKTDGINIINLKKTWEKMVLAASAIAAVENPLVLEPCPMGADGNLGVYYRLHSSSIYKGLLTNYVCQKWMVENLPSSLALLCTPVSPSL